MARPRPNLIVIYTDQQRHDTIHALGNDVIRTPNMDRLCAEGTTYVNATTSCPVCMPARWSLHTGQWTSTHRCYSNHLEGPRPDVDLPGCLRAAGYHTGLVGKNHSFLTPRDLDVFEEHPHTTDELAGRARGEFMKENRKRFPRLLEIPAAGGVEGDPERAKTDAAMRFIRNADDAPYFLWLSYHNPHTPYVAPEPYFSMYEKAELPPPRVEADGLAAAGKPFRQRFHQSNNDKVHPFDARQIDLMRRLYYGMITLVDDEIGRLLAFLQERGDVDDTLIVFMSDHGDYQGDHGLITKSPALYDCLVRIPFVMRHPGRVPAGRRDERFASAVDVMPTLLAAAGAAIPQSVEGRDLLSLLEPSRVDEAVRPCAFSEYGIPGTPYDEERLAAEGLDGDPITWIGKPARGEGLPWEGNPVSLAGRTRMARTKEWTLVDEPGGTCELYNIVDDPGELVNLYGRAEYDGVVGELRAFLG